jgi:hypothetical protein
MASCSTKEERERERERNEWKVSIQEYIKENDTRNKNNAFGRKKIDGGNNPKIQKKI